MQTPEERKQKKAARNKKWREANIERCATVTKKYRQSHLIEFNEYRNEYRKKNPRGIYDVVKQGAKRRNLPFELNRDAFEVWYLNQPRICVYCKRSESVVVQDKLVQKESQRLTIDRMDNSLGYSISNIALSCQRCNNIKGNFFTYDEMVKIGRIIRQKLLC